MSGDGRQGLEDMQAHRFAADDERTSADLTVRVRASFTRKIVTGRHCACGRPLGPTNKSGDCARCGNRRRAKEHPNQYRKKKSPPFTTSG